MRHRKGPWNTLEVAKIVATLFVPITIAVLGIWVNSQVRNAEARRNGWTLAVEHSEAVNNYSAALVRFRIWSERVARANVEVDPPTLERQADELERAFELYRTKSQSLEPRLRDLFEDLHMPRVMAFSYPRGVKKALQLAHHCQMTSIRVDWDSVPRSPTKDGLAYCEEDVKTAENCMWTFANLVEVAVYEPERVKELTEPGRPESLDLSKCKEF